MKRKHIQCEGRAIGENCAAYIIAEIGSNHNQDLETALNMIESAAKAGADAVKFQSLMYDEIYIASHETDEFKTWFSAIELKEEWYQALSQKAAEQGVDFISAPCYEKSVALLEEVDVPLYKLGSPQVQGDLRTLRAAARTGKPLLLSLGYCNPDEIERAIKVCQEEQNDQIVLLHCISNYPTDFSESNLRYLTTLRETYGCHVGFSDHTPGGHLACAAIALGACVIEKHVTDDRAQDGPDHHFALTFDEFAKMVTRVRDVENALGTGQVMPLLPGVQELRKRYRYKAFARRDIKANEVLDDSNLATYRSESFHDALSLDDIVSKGARAKHALQKNQPVFIEDLDA